MAPLHQSRMVTVLSLCHFVNQSLIAMTLGQMELQHRRALRVLQAPISRRSATRSSRSRAPFFSAVTEQLGDWFDLDLVQLALLWLKFGHTDKLVSYFAIRSLKYFLGEFFFIHCSKRLHFKLTLLRSWQTRCVKTIFWPADWQWLFSHTMQYHTEKNRHSSVSDQGRFFPTFTLWTLGINHSGRPRVSNNNGWPAHYVVSKQTWQTISNL